MNHLAAFILRLASVAATMVPGTEPGTERTDIGAVMQFCDAADAYDRPVFPIDAPAWLRWNCPGGEA